MGKMRSKQTDLEKKNSSSFFNMSTQDEFDMVTNRWMIMEMWKRLNESKDLKILAS